MRNDWWMPGMLTRTPSREDDQVVFLRQVEADLDDGPSERLFLAAALSGVLFAQEKKCAGLARELGKHKAAAEEAAEATQRRATGGDGSSGVVRAQLRAAEVSELLGQADGVRAFLLEVRRELLEAELHRHVPGQRRQEEGAALRSRRRRHPTDERARRGTALSDRGQAHSSGVADSAPAAAAAAAAAAAPSGVSAPPVPPPPPRASPAESPQASGAPGSVTRGGGRHAAWYGYGTEQSPAAAAADGGSAAGADTPNAANAVAAELRRAFDLMDAGRRAAAQGVAENLLLGIRLTPGKEEEEDEEDEEDEGQEGGDKEGGSGSGVGGGEVGLGSLGGGEGEGGVEVVAAAVRRCLEGLGFGPLLRAYRFSAHDVLPVERGGAAYDDDDDEEEEEEARGGGGEPRRRRRRGRGRGGGGSEGGTGEGAEFGRPYGFEGLVMASPHGVPILVADHAADLALLTGIAQGGQDVFFRVCEGRGAPVLLRFSLLRGLKGSRKCIQMAADLAAYFSEARGSCLPPPLPPGSRPVPGYDEESYGDDDDEEEEEETAAAAAKEKAAETAKKKKEEEEKEEEEGRGGLRAEGGGGNRREGRRPSLDLCGVHDHCVDVMYMDPRKVASRRAKHRGASSVRAALKFSQRAGRLRAYPADVAAAVEGRPSRARHDGRGEDGGYGGCGGYDDL